MMLDMQLPVHNWGHGRGD